MTPHTHTNDLTQETSPYLLQHAHNPVNWMAWSTKAWDKAKKEDKLVLVSIGYSACHWCHVMEHESFEDEMVARIMNDHYVSIKVDREERPDVDQIYMDAVQIITGHGGWPLNAICLPDGRPIYAGTYFRKEDWKQVLLYMTDYFTRNRDEVMQRATEITHGIKVLDTIPLIRDTTFQAGDRVAMFDKIDRAWDYEKGGRTGAPKFPMPVTMQYLLQNYHYTKNEMALRAVTVTLDNMMDGGIYDHVGGGFARYSVDDSWTIPHFEKMLYDNAQLVSLYSAAYQITKNESYKQVVFDTLAYVGREMTDVSGGFYSALDADSEGVEGKFYVWTYNELNDILGHDFEAFCEYYDVTKEGNFEHGWINLRRQTTDHGSRTSNADELKQWGEKLMEVRSKRIRPGLDDKILTSWNALMLKGLIDAYNAFGEERFLETALANAHFIKKNCLQADHSINRTFKWGKSSISGFLDDYSFTIEAFIALYQATFDEQWLDEAKHLADHAIQHFYSGERGVFFYTSINDDPLIARKTETTDNVIPSSNSSMAKSLFLLGHLYDSAHYLHISRQQMMNLKENALTHTAFYANWAMLMDSFIDEPYEVAIAGANSLELRKEIAKSYLPNVIILGTLGESKLPLLADKTKSNDTRIYVCKDKTCGLPVRSSEEAMNQMR
ncbi:MAG: thioredoxin protein [Bacteroidetes bacterium]|nr:thioredoxin protein [Bacteroidota bacterium]